jgi:hypothetical protein
MEIFELNDERVNTMTEKEAKETLNHLRKQFQERYNFLLGIWAGSKKAKSTRDGKFVSIQEVINWLND